MNRTVKEVHSSIVDVICVNYLLVVNRARLLGLLATFEQYIYIYVYLDQNLTLIKQYCIKM